MTIKVIPVENNTTPSELEYMAFLGLSRDEVATIWYALRAYKEAVLTTAAEAEGTPNQVEEEAFCYEVAQKCAKLQFAILYDHTKFEQERVQRFLDIE